MQRPILLLMAALLSACFDFEPAGLLTTGPAGTYGVDLEAAKAALAEEMRAESEGVITFRSDAAEEEMQDLAWATMEEYLRSISFVLRADGTWESTQTLVEESTASGTWELDGETLTLRRLVEDEVELATPTEVEAAYRDSSIVLSDESGQELVLVRK
jgi:hypothetical protein